MFALLSMNAFWIRFPDSNPITDYYYIYYLYYCCCLGRNNQWKRMSFTDDKYVVLVLIVSKSHYTARIHPMTNEHNIYRTLATRIQSTHCRCHQYSIHLNARTCSNPFCTLYNHVEMNKHVIVFFSWTNRPLKYLRYGKQQTVVHYEKWWHWQWPNIG